MPAVALLPRFFKLSVITPGEKAGWAYLQPRLPQQDMTLSHDPTLSAVLSLRSDQPLINGPLCQTEILSCASHCLWEITATHSDMCIDTIKWAQVGRTQRDTKMTHYASEL